MIPTYTYLYSSLLSPQLGKQGIYLQIFTRKAISQKIWILSPSNKMFYLYNQICDESLLLVRVFELTDKY